MLATAAGTSQDDDGRVGAALLGFTGIAVTILALTFAVPSIICGWGLLKRRRWARILAIVLAAISLIEFPVGTVFGVYVLWVLFNKETEALFLYPLLIGLVRHVGPPPPFTLISVPS